MSEPSLDEFCQTYNLVSIVNKPTCFKSPKNPSCIDLMLTNKQERFLKAKTIETGLFDFHKMVVSVFKTSFKKQKPKIVTYRDYKRFDNETFRESPITYLSTGKNISYDAFENLVLQTLDKMAPIKQKHIRGNQSPFMNKDIHKAIMTRTRLRNRFLKEPTQMNRLAYKKQRNYCVSLMRQNKKQYYGSLNVNHITDNKNFWRVVKPNFSNKILGTNRVTLRDGGKVISDTERVADTFNKFFVNIGNTLKIDKDKQFLVETNDVFDPVLKAIKKYSAHPSILSIKEKINNNVFSFRKVTYEEILNETNSLDTSKSTQSEDIPFKIIKDNADIFANFILQSFNKCIIGGKFPDQLKKSDVSPVFKKENHNDKTNYRPVSILPSLSKIYKRLIYNQINQMTENAYRYFSVVFAKKKYSTQHALIAMIEKAKENIDKGGTFGALLTDLSKAFDCMTYDLLIAKLHALNFDMNALNLIFDYLTGRKQRVKINSSFSSYLDIFQGVPQGSILEPLLFNLFLCDLFLFVEEVHIMSYADDNTPYVCSENVDVTLEKLEEVGKVLFEWFSNNFLKANADKCHLILSTDEPFSINIDNEVA